MKTTEVQATKVIVGLKSVEGPPEAEASIVQEEVES